MSDSYQAIYDAVRSRISGGNVSEAITDVARQAFDISNLVPIIAQEVSWAASYWRQPSVLMRPRLYIDGNQWCALYGDNIQDGVAGFGDTPELAMDDFNAAWGEKIPATAAPVFERMGLGETKMPGL